MPVAVSQKRLMVFVDGSNFLIELSKEVGISFRADKPPLEALHLADLLLKEARLRVPHHKIRRYWFASYQGDDSIYYQLRKDLRDQDFEPILFKKHSGKEKGVDIALTKEMLVNAFNQNFEIGLLVAGDADYVDLVHEVKRYGPIVFGAFLKRGLSPELELAFDAFHDLSPALTRKGGPGPEVVNRLRDKVSSSA